jgi:hypothetical protein
MLTGCQSMTGLEVTPAEGQQRYYQDGSVALVSSQAGSIAAIAAKPEGNPNGQRLNLALRVVNTGEAPFDIDTTQIQVTADTPKPIRVYSHAQLVKEEVDKRNAALFITALAGAANAYSASQAGYVRTSGSYNGRTYGPGGTYSSHGSYSGTYYDPARAQIAGSIASAQTANNIDRIASNSANNVATLDSLILKRTTVFPGQEHSGLFVFDAPPLKKGERRVYRIDVRTGDDVHVFNIVQSHPAS